MQASHIIHAGSLPFPEENPQEAAYEILRLNSNEYLVNENSRILSGQEVSLLQNQEQLRKLCNKAWTGSDMLKEELGSLWCVCEERDLEVTERAFEELKETLGKRKRDEGVGGGEFVILEDEEDGGNERKWVEMMNAKEDQENYEEDEDKENREFP
jgi:hypothetical protein